MMQDLVVIILTFNEERNLEKAIDSVGDHAPVIVVDSGSTDGTLDIARSRGAEVLQRPLEDYATQRNFALDSAKDRYEWVFFLDADEEFTPPLWSEIEAMVAAGAVEGAYVGLVFRVLGHDLTHGAFGSAAILRLMRADKARFARGTNERVDDRELNVGHLQNKLLHNDAKPLAEWFRKHVRYAEREAAHYLDDDTGLDGFSWRTKAGRTVVARWAYNRMPLFVRPFIHFGRTVVWQSAWRDGLPGIMFAGLQSFWYPMMIDVFIYEEKRRRKRAAKGGR